jgi:AbrB family looped-hinge helix DNA binding protein
MADAGTQKMSSKGQVVIPEEIRDRLGLKAGAQFVVVGLERNRSGLPAPVP